MWPTHRLRRRPVGPGAAAVAAAESQIGVPYVWGDESPGSGFDCSGLTAWAWGQAGVSLPHYSGAQMADSTPVPLSDLEPGDLLFYGPGGATHVAMYVGGGSDDRGPVHRGERLDHRPAHRHRPLRRRRPAVAAPALRRHPARTAAAQARHRSGHTGRDP